MPNPRLRWVGPLNRQIPLTQKVNINSINPAPTPACNFAPTPTPDSSFAPVPSPDSAPSSRYIPPVSSPQCFRVSPCKPQQVPKLGGLPWYV